MTVRIRAYDELPPGVETQRALLQMSAFSEASFDPPMVRRYRARGLFSPYVGLFALERDQLLAQAFALRIPFTFRHGTEPVAGVSAVTTRPDVAREGIGRTLMQSMLRRERRAGTGYSLLWTNRSWGAHRLYESLGYRDIYHPRSAARSGPFRRALPNGWAARAARRADLRELEAFHRRHARSRLGFVQRFRGCFQIETELGFLELETILVLRHRSRLAGYALLSPSPTRLLCGEFEAADDDARDMLLTSIEVKAGRKLVVVRRTPVTDHGAELRDRGYTLFGGDWFVLMGLALNRPLSTASAVEEFATRDPRFLCQAFDGF